jgi:hypothetical protein
MVTELQSTDSEPSRQPDFYSNFCVFISSIKSANTTTEKSRSLEGRNCSYLRWDRRYGRPKNDNQKRQQVSLTSSSLPAAVGRGGVIVILWELAARQDALLPHETGSGLACPRTIENDAKPLVCLAWGGTREGWSWEAAAGEAGDGNTGERR